MVRYRERLWAPARWWALAAAFAGSVWLVYQHAYGPRVSAPAAAAALMLGAALLLGYGWLEIRVDDDAVTVGRARLPLSALGKVEALSSDAARLARGPELDPRAYVAIRGYVPSVVRMEVADDADPTPYWLTSTRRPERLVAALEAARRGASQ